MKTIIYIGVFLWSINATSQPQNDFEFKSPAFNGNGYSGHVLTIENQEHSRKKAIADKLESQLKEAAREAGSTNIAKFMSNLESRIYAQISQDLATAMFTDDSSSPTSGTLNFEGNIINWSKTSSTINLSVIDIIGTTTSIAIPLGDFTF
jgi:hypothetical protein|tara:strand:- start:3473 stop:3922 length:450 start_codon:yes stop_codon:yes gene_type:complete